MNAKKTHSGQCHCGSIKFEAAGDPVVVAHCYCADCQRLSGAGHATGAMYLVSQFQLTGGVAEYSLVADNGNRVTKTFCPNCSSPIYGRNSGSPDFLTISVGAFDDPSQFKPQVAVFTGNQMPWDEMSTDVIKSLHTFDTQPDWDPNEGI